MAKHKNPGYGLGRTRRLRDLSNSSQMIHHGELISAYAKFCHAQVIVEIGVQRGNTTSYLCEAAALTGGKVYGYDFFPEGEETIGAYDKKDQKYPIPTFCCAWANCTHTLNSKKVVVGTISLANVGIGNVHKLWKFYFQWNKTL